MTTLSLIGAGHIHTPGFVDKLRKAAGIKVAAVWDHDAARARKHAQALGARAVGTPAEAMDADGVEAVIIASETNRHDELVAMAVEHRRHLFVEKPLGYAARDAYQMAAAIEKEGLVFQTGYFMRGQPVHIFLKEQIAAGSFGVVTRARHSNCHGGSLGGWFDTEWRWMADPSVAGCGAYGDLGTHSLDILLWLFGKVTRVVAEIRPVTRRYGECDETGEGMLVFESGVVATLAAGWLDVVNPVTALVSGTKGHAHVDGGQLYVSSEALKADGKTPYGLLPDPRLAGFDLFLQVMAGKGDRSRLVSAREAAHRSAVMEALYTSNTERRWVEPVWEVA